MSNNPDTTPTAPAVGSTLADGAEVVKMTKVVRIADVDGKPIREGDVLRSIKDGDQGVVVKIMRVGDWGSGLEQVGDLKISTSPGCTRVTNQYANWRHVPRNEQTYDQRFLSWFHDRDALNYNCLSDDGEKTDDAKKAISGIMALLPEDVVCWETGPWPDTVEDALRFLVQHLSANAKPSGGPQP